MHSPKSLTGLTTLLCQSILEDPVESSHITLNIPLQSVSAYFRVGFENSFAVTSFTVTPRHCLGSILVEPDGRLLAGAKDVHLEHPGAVSRPVSNVSNTGTYLKACLLEIHTGCIRFSGNHQDRPGMGHD